MSILIFIRKKGKITGLCNCDGYADRMENKFEMLSEKDRVKYEIAEELGLLDKVKKEGWKSLSAKESGKIGGIMTARMKSQAKKQKKN